MAPSLQLIIHLLAYFLCGYLLAKAFRRKLRAPADCLAERNLQLRSEILLNEAEFLIMFNKPMTQAQLNQFFGTFSRYFTGTRT
jgi:hypothetical protein